MPTVNEINEFLNRRVPYVMKWEFDNVGFLAGNGDTDVNIALAALDITDAVVSEAIASGAQLILSHHPLIRDGMKNVTTNSPTGKIVVRLIENGVSAICLHTNLDCAIDGTSDALCRTLGIDAPEILDDEKCLDGYGAYGIGKYGELKLSAADGEQITAMTLEDFLRHVKKNLGTNGLRFVEGDREVKKIAVCGGSGGEYVRRAYDLGCDTYITADVRHGQFLEAKSLGINLIDAGHFSTENVVVPKLAAMLLEGFPGVETIISAACIQPEEYY